MVSAIILLLVVLSAGLVVGAFIVALNELEQIDDIAEPSHDPNTVSPINQG